MALPLVIMLGVWAFHGIRAAVAVRGMYMAYQVGFWGFRIVNAYAVADRLKIITVASAAGKYLVKVYEDGRATVEPAPGSPPVSPELQKELMEFVRRGKQNARSKAAEKPVNMCPI